MSFATATPAGRTMLKVWAVPCEGIITGDTLRAVMRSLHVNGPTCKLIGSKMIIILFKVSIKLRLMGLQRTIVLHNI